jgi:hypothetical protein
MGLIQLGRSSVKQVNELGVGAEAFIGEPSQCRGNIKPAEVDAGFANKSYFEFAESF